MGLTARRGAPAVAKIAIVADDLTGALDSSVAFADRDLSVVVALRPTGVAQALSAGADVVVVNTASRGLSAIEAGQRTAEVCKAILAAGRPGIVFKKIDSRLKGNVRSEVAAVHHVFGGGPVIVAPSVPDQQRTVDGGAVVGRGVGAPIPIADHVPDGCVIIDAATEGQLDALVASVEWQTAVAVGARGLGRALARYLGHSGQGLGFVPHRATLFAIGSADPISNEQMAELADDSRVSIVTAPDGIQADSVPRLPALLRTTGAPWPNPSMVTERFARTVVRAIDELNPQSVVISGGDTALAILDLLGVEIVYPMGEALPGLPWFLVDTETGPLRCVLKSGGFGDGSTLVRLLSATSAQKSRRHT